MPTTTLTTTTTNQDIVRARECALLVQLLWQSSLCEVHASSVQVKGPLHKTRRTQMFNTINRTKVPNPPREEQCHDVTRLSGQRNPRVRRTLHQHISSKVEHYLPKHQRHTTSPCFGLQTAQCLGFKINVRFRIEGAELLNLELLQASAKVSYRWMQHLGIQNWRWRWQRMILQL